MFRMAGFSLFEVLFVVLIAAILAVIGIPSFNYVTSSNRISTEVNGLLGDMQFARSEAIKEGQYITVCASSNGTTCSGASAWQTGWIVFVDTNDNQQVNSGEALLRVQNTFNGTDTLASSSALSAVTFNREGFAAGYAAAATVTLPVTLNLHSSPVNTAFTRCLALSFAGMPTTEIYGIGTPACT
jgi:type IV fimbrial biogenesis protein FimT